MGLWRNLISYNEILEILLRFTSGPSELGRITLGGSRRIG
jgi:hypothetical protein